MPASDIRGYTHPGMLNGKRISVVIRADENLIYSVEIKRKYSASDVSPDCRNQASVDAASFFDAFFSRRIDTVPVSVLYDRGCLEVKYNYGGITLRLDMSGRTLKQIKVYSTLLMIPYGETISYSALALKAGYPRAARFAGSLMASNRFPVIVPCHRVVRSDGSIGEYSGGAGMKEDLLIHEASEKRIYT